MVTLSFGEDEASDAFRGLGFAEFDDCYRMVRKLDTVKEDRRSFSSYRLGETRRVSSSKWHRSFSKVLQMLD
jgi:hypothetical protein